jgi:mono/diheme cytochrome c family protein
MPTARDEKTWSYNEATRMLRNALLICSLATAGATAATTSFSTQILPILQKHCAGCHNQTNPQSNLSLTGYEAIKKGGSSGPGIETIPKYISGTSPRMPKGGPPLDPSEIDLISSWIAAGAPDDTPPNLYFEQNVSAILERNCLRCHNPQAKTSGLSLDTRTSALTGGRRGAAIKPGSAEASELYKMIFGAQPKMPKQSDPLAPEEVAAVKKWIDQGAIWPERIALKFRTNQAATSWWSLQPLRQPPVNASIDKFIQAKLEANGLTPSPQADRRTLIRRLTYDLHGLPPTPEEIDAFIADQTPNAYEKLVDRLLASPRYGERWGRHWLDVVHYGESHGYDKDKPRPNAWPYRDWVINAFNNDKPYKEFVEEQLAGDILHPNKNDAIIATGFVAAGPWDFVGQVELREGTKDKEITRTLDRDDIVAQTMSTFVSMTAHCARCHDHKFDPILQEDYYSLQAVFAGVDRADRPLDDDPQIAQARKELLAERKALERQFEPLRLQEANVTSPEIEQLEKQISEWKLQIGDLPAGESQQKTDLQAKVKEGQSHRRDLVRSLLDPAARDKMDRLAPEIEAINKKLAALPKPRLVYAAASYFDRSGTFGPALDPRPIHVLPRGNVETPGKLVGPGTLSCVQGTNSRFDIPAGSDEGARRVALAHWITDRNNMLTWRSIVNRVWQYHFGMGIVDSPNDFGRMGAKPSNPELLDWLAVWFRDDASGSIKKLHKLILMSAAYQQSSANRTDAEKIDADNRYLWRMNRARLDGEEVRDATLFVTGKLDLRMGGPPDKQFFFKDDHSPVYDYSRFDVDSPESLRRSIYRFLVRSVQDPLMERLDCPDPSILTPKRDVTITAIQALALLNNKLMVRQAEYLAQRLRTISKDPSQQVKAAYQLALGREPTEPETQRMMDYGKKYDLENVCRVILNSSEFLFVD